MFKDILRKAYDEKKMIGITTQDISWDESIIGYIIDIDETYFVINEIDEYGIYIGNTIIEIKNVTHVETNNWYMNNLQLIQEKGVTFNPNLRVTIWKQGGNLKKYLEYLKINNQISRFFFEEDNFVIGEVLEFNNEFVFINNIGQDGSNEGKTCYQLEDIVGLRYNGLEEQKIKFLIDLKCKEK